MRYPVAAAAVLNSVFALIAAGCSVGAGSGAGSCARAGALTDTAPAIARTDAKPSALRSMRTPISSW